MMTQRKHSKHRNGSRRPDRRHHDGLVGNLADHFGHPADFAYIPSSMGQGIALPRTCPSPSRVRGAIAVMGDGSLLMNLGSLVTVANHPARARRADRQRSLRSHRRPAGRSSLWHDRLCRTGIEERASGGSINSTTRTNGGRTRRRP